MLMFIWRKLPADTRFDLSLDWQFILPLIAMLSKEPKNAETRCVLRVCNTAKCDCGRAPDPAGKAYSVLPRTHGGATGLAGSVWPPKFGWVGYNAFGPTSNWPVYSSILFVNFLKLVTPDVRF